MALADSFIALDYMFGKMQWMLDGLQTYPAKMEHNLWRTKGLIFSSKVLLALVDAGITREDAYVIVQRNAMKVWEDIQNAVDGPTYRERLEADAEAMALLARRSSTRSSTPGTSSPARTSCSIACRSWSSSRAHLLPARGSGSPPTVQPGPALVRSWIAVLRPGHKGLCRGVREGDRWPLS